MGSNNSKESKLPGDYNNDSNPNSLNTDLDRKGKYKIDSFNFFYQYYSHYKKRKEWIEKSNQQLLQDKNNQEIRSKIRVLIIIGSYPNFQFLDKDSNYFEDAEDFTTAFLICHLFHYAFLIPYSQILITLTKENGFKDKNTNVRFQDMDSKTKLEKINDLTFEFLDNEFGFSQNVNYAQIGKVQYKFALENDLLNRIRPFDHNIIINEINPNDKSDIFVFFLDHSRLGFFRDNEYRYCVDELIQIPCFHYYIMNDSCFSGSLIEIIKASYDFVNIVKNRLDSALEYTFIKLLLTYGNFDSEILFEQSLNHIINDVLKNQGLENNFIPIFKDIYKNEMLNLFKFGKKISEICPSGILFTPKNFVKFAEKATIFSSSDYKNISLTLPARRISVLLNDNYRICGSVFSSIFIESLLNANSSFKSFCSSIEMRFKSYKADFENIIIYQNQNKEEENSNQNKEEENSNQNKKILNQDQLKNTLNKSLVSKESVISFFDMKDFKDKHIFSISNIWPDINSIFVKDMSYWNVDFSFVDTNEYQNVFFCNLIKDAVVKENPKEYGPKRGMSSIEKYLIDYEKEVNKIMLQKGYNNIQFSTIQPTNDEKDNKYKNLNFINWSKFVISIRPYYSSRIGLGIMGLKYPISIFFNDYPNFDKEIGVKIFSEAFENIYPFWKDHSIYF